MNAGFGVSQIDIRNLGVGFKYFFMFIPTSGNDPF